MSIKICVDARFVPGSSGGTEHLVRGLAAGLSALRDGDENYAFLALHGYDDWLRPYMGGSCETVLVDVPFTSHVRRLARRIPRARATYRRARSLVPSRGSRVRIPVSDGTVERIACDVVHFPLQSAFVTSVPSIYHPHDLQHVYLPQFFTKSELAFREATYGAFCRSADLVAVSSTWARLSIIEHYRLPAEKVRVIPLAPAIQAKSGGSLSDLAGYSLPNRFVFYPAHMWPHKNHLGLLEAIARLRDRHGVTLPIVFCGQLTDHTQVVRRVVHSLRLESDVKILGYLGDDVVAQLYRRATLLVLPTRFEAASFPIWEAFLAGVPVATSNVTSLPDQVGDAALLFDPDDTEGMATAIWALWTDPQLRAQLIERAHERVASYNWQRTARTFRAHYRQIARQRLSSDDEQLLAMPPPL